MASETDLDRWQRYTRVLRDEPLPCALIDLDALESNARVLSAFAAGSGKKLRLASKSVRVPDILRRLLEGGAPTVQGLMTYTVTETAYLFEQGFDDLLIAYPSVQRSDAELLADLAKRGATVSIVVDAVDQIRAISEAACTADTSVRIVIEVDMAFRAARGAVHLGARRSPLHDARAVADLADKVRDLPGVEVYGVMGYEGQIAGSTDKSPFSPWMNPAKRAVKLLSKGPVASTRSDVDRALKARGHAIELFNGGGTGSLRWSTQEDVLTEVTAGSGYLGSHLFSYYRDVTLTPAAYFALQVVRRPMPGMVACLGGGYIASGECGLDRLPVPALPPGGKLLGFEGAGEVQTPVVLPPNIDVPPGDPYFFRHAKAGELAEHFPEYVLIRGDKIEGRAKTYRGLGECFLG